MIKIYELVDEDDVCLYVGRTINMRTRELGHRTQIKKEGGCGSQFIPYTIKWVMKLIEECPGNIANEREAYWIHKKNPPYNIVKLDKYLKKPPIWIQENGRMIINPDRNL